MSRYTAYGLSIDSGFVLPELPTGGAGTDVVIKIGNIRDLPSAASDAESGFHATPNEVFLFWKEVGTFLVRDGQEIIVAPAPEVEESVLRLFTLGAVLAVLLHQRGFLVLHGTTVMINGCAVTFLGNQGRGKSTLAAALYKQGHSLIADDVTAIDMEADCPMVYPGYPQLKLWPDVATFLGDDIETLPRVNPRLEKRIRRVTRGFPAAPLPLRRIYVLAPDKCQKVDAIQSSETLAELVRHSYVAVLLQATETSTAHFHQCAKLLHNVAMYRLKRQRCLSALPHLCCLVENHLASLNH